MMSNAMNLSRNKHAILLYQNNFNLDLTSAQCINQGLEEKQLCVYASVNGFDKSHLLNISSQIMDYEENIRKRNLLIVDLKPYYECALVGDLTPFKELELQLRQELVNRGTANNSDVLIIADCADNLFMNQRFDQCEMVENWWHNIYNDWLKKQQQQGKERNHLTVICPYSSSLLNKHPYDQHKHKISHNHSIVIDTTGHIVTKYTSTEEERISNTKAAASQIHLSKRVLIAEPDPDLRHLYSIWLHQMGYKDIVVTDSGRKCLDEALKITHSQSYLVIILDTHLKDIPVTEVAKKIIDRKPNQHIVFTTTLPLDSLSQTFISTGLDNIKETTITKPFRLSTLSAVIDESFRKHQDPNHYFS
ncbi:MAG: response regulator [Nitrososphaeraceae archaeon]